MDIAIEAYTQKLTHTYMIAPFWDDVFPPDGGNIYVQSFGTYWVAVWQDIYHYDSPLLGSFEVILYDTGEIIFNYDYLNYTDHLKAWMASQEVNLER